MKNIQTFIFKNQEMAKENIVKKSCYRPGTTLWVRSH